MQFRYHAADASGNLVDGEIDAPDAVEAKNRLQAEGMDVLSLRPVDERKAPSETDSPDPPEKSDAAQDEEVLSTSEFEELSGHVAEITRAELPLAPALMAIAEESPSGRFRQTLRAMVADLEAGHDLEEVLARHNAPDDLRVVVRSGARSGRLGEVLGQYVSHSRTAARLRRQIVLGLAYPAVLIVVGLIVTGLFLVLLVPDFKKIFEDFGVELPAITLFMIGLSDFAVGYGVWVLPVLVLAGIALWKLLPLLIDPVTLRRIVGWIPFVGRMLQWSALSRFSNHLALFIDSKLPFPQALVLAGDASRDAALSAACRSLAEQVERGERLSEGNYAFAGFPIGFARRMSREAHRDRFPELLETLADLFAGRARFQTGLVVALCRVLFFLTVFMMFGLLILAMFLPLIKLLNDLS